MQRSSLDILLFLSSMGPTIKIRIPITTHKANEKIDGITAYFAISKTILKTIPDNTVQLQNLSKCTPPANALSNEKKVKNRIPYAKKESCSGPNVVQPHPVSHNTDKCSPPYVY